jgi:hypothetical protein
VPLDLMGPFPLGEFCHGAVSNHGAVGDLANRFAHAAILAEYRIPWPETIPVGPYIAKRWLRRRVAVAFRRRRRDIWSPVVARRDELGRTMRSFLEAAL